MNMNIMIVTNSRYLPYAYTLLYSLFKYHPCTEMDVYLPYEDISDIELGELTAFVEGFAGKRLRPLFVGSDFKTKVKSRNGIHVETYYRILAIDMLPAECERILYLDVDMIIHGSLAELYDTDMTEKAFAVCEDIFGIINGFHEANKYRMHIPSEYSYFNAGVMLYNLSYLRSVHASADMLERIYADYERYEYNDQDVMNELFYDRLVYVGWDIYNLPPTWYYLDKVALAEGNVKFADYDTIRRYSERGDGGASLNEDFQNVTRQMYDNARVIHYLADTKPWSTTRKKAAIFELFDRAYIEISDELKGEI